MPLVGEPILEPELPIVDAHHHLWLLTEAELAPMERATTPASRRLAATFRRHARYLVDELLADLNSGHNIRATVYVEAEAMYRIDAPVPLRSLGEVEFANGMAAIAASGVLTDRKICAGIVGSVDLRLGDAVEEVLQAHLQAGGGRYRGVRGRHVPGDNGGRNPGNFGPIPALLNHPDFCAGLRQLTRLGLSYDVWLLEFQLGELVALAQAFPDTQIIVNHVGGLFAQAGDADREQQRFALWRDNITALAACPNVAMKLGGLGMPMSGLPTTLSIDPPTSQQLADDWRPYIETCVEAFGATRCLFESNFPVDAASASYAVLWNAFKRSVAGASATEKQALFSDTAARIYRIDI